VEEALKIDEQSGTDFWRKAMGLEINNVLPAFEFRDDKCCAKVLQAYRLPHDI
jgi:hypothetical protein